MKYYLIHLKAGKVVKVSQWSEAWARDQAFLFYATSSHGLVRFDELQMLDEDLEETW